SRKPDNSRPFTPKTTQTLRQHRRPSYGTIETSRERHYNLDFSADPEIAAADLLNPHSRFYARPKPRSLDLPSLLPYETENLQERARFLSHIVAHLYIAVKTLDIQGSVAVSAKDLAALRDVPGFSDIDMALETNLFEMNSASSDEPEDAEPELEPEFGDDDFDENDELDSGTGSGAESDENDEFETGDSASQHKKSPRSAAVVSVRIWTHELLVWLQMKYDMPVSLRMALAKVYYAICCCRGQHVNLKIYVRAFETLTKNTVFLQEQGLSLDWQPVYNELALHFPSPDSLHEPLEKKDLNSLLKLGERASNFFSPDSLPILFRHIASYYSIPNATLVLWCMRILPQKFVANFAPDSPNRELDMRHYIAPVFH
ncbi:hypothetical protein OXX59_010014, partial [Metschnikowia pulcherrima]